MKNPVNLYKRHRFPSEIIQNAIWLYYRFSHKLAKRSGFLLLDKNADALNWRLALVDSAESSLDILYYLWYGHDSGRLLLDRVINAYIIPDQDFISGLKQIIEKGVEVRILTNSLASHDVPAVNIDSPGLGSEMHRLADRDMSPQNAWQVKLGDDGKLVWINSDETVTRQPARNAWQRFMDVFFMIVPKSQL